LQDIWHVRKCAGRFAPDRHSRGARRSGPTYRNARPECATWYRSGQP
jgi:hypothetical protein